METAGYIFIGIVVAIWIITMIAGLIAAFPFGLIGIIAIIGFGFLLMKVVRDRLNNREDDYYNENVEK